MVRPDSSSGRLTASVRGVASLRLKPTEQAWDRNGEKSCTRASLETAVEKRRLQRTRGA